MEVAIMKVKKADKNMEKEVLGDPAFYNDQIDENKEPIKAVMEKRKSKKRKG